MFSVHQIKEFLPTRRAIDEQLDKLLQKQIVVVSTLDEPQEYWLKRFDEFFNDNTEFMMIDMDQVYESYFMYHRYRYPDDLLFTSFQQMLSDLTKEQWGNSTVFSYFLDHLTDEKHQYIISEFERWIDSGEQFYSSLAPHTI